MILTKPNKSLLRQTMNIDVLPTSSIDDSVSTSFLKALSSSSNDLFTRHSGTVFYACLYIKEFINNKTYEMQYSNDKNFNQIQGLAELYLLSKELDEHARKSRISSKVIKSEGIIEGIRIDLTRKGRKKLKGFDSSFTIKGSEAISLLGQAIRELYVNKPYKDWEFSSFGMVEYYDITNFRFVKERDFKEGANLKKVIFEDLRKHTKKFYQLLKTIHPNSDKLPKQPAIIGKTILDLYNHFHIPLPIPSNQSTKTLTTLDDKDSIKLKEKELIRLIGDWGTK